MASSLTIERLPSAELSASMHNEIRCLCDAAYAVPTEPFFAGIGPGEHLVGLLDGTPVTHLMWVTRWLQPAGSAMLRTAYVEMVATAPARQNRGYATALLAALPPLVRDYDLAALCPATQRPYARLGWRFWRGPLSVRRGQDLMPTPEERVMILPLPRTPRLDMDLPLSIEWRPGEVW